MRVSCVALIIAFVIGIIALAAFLGWSIVVGSLLSRLVSFSLFEGSLLAMFGSTVIGYIAWHLLAAFTMPGIGDYEELDEDDFEGDDGESPEDEIPPDRFFKGNTDRTWAAWLSYRLSNQINHELEKSPALVSMMDQTQRRELAVRLSEVGLALLKSKTGRAKQLRVTLADLRKQMQKLDMKPYDDNLLSVAVRVINLEIGQPATEHVIRSRLWDKPITHKDMGMGKPPRRNF